MGHAFPPRAEAYSQNQNQVVRESLSKARVSYFYILLDFWSPPPIQVNLHVNVYKIHLSFIEQFSR